MGMIIDYYHTKNIDILTSSPQSLSFPPLSLSPFNKYRYQFLSLPAQKPRPPSFSLHAAIVTSLKLAPFFFIKKKQKLITLIFFKNKYKSHTAHQLKRNSIPFSLHFLMRSSGTGNHR